MSPVVEPAVDERLGRLLGLLEVALEDVAAAADHLAVVGDATSQPGIARPTVPGRFALGDHVIGPVDSDMP